MSKIKKYSFVLACMLFAFAGQAQKFGYLNSTQLMGELPEVKAANSELETYQNQLVTKGENMVKDLQAKIQSYTAEAQGGTLSAVEMQKREEAFAADEKKIQAYELEVQNKLFQKREEVLTPILDKVKKAIEDVGKENGYTMIFDSNAGTILHAAESDNVEALVKAKLGM